MTTKQRNAIRRGLKKSHSRRRRSKAMKESWARRRYDKEMSQPNACVNAATESHEALPEIHQPTDFSRIEAITKLWRGLRDQSSWFTSDTEVMNIINGAVDRLRLAIILEVQKAP